MVRSKDSVNHFLKAASRLTSIEEAAVEGYSTASSGSSGSSGQSGTPGSKSKSSSSSSAESETLRACQRLQQQQQQQQQQKNSSSKYPNIDFLENDVNLWDAFFLRSKNSGRLRSVLMKPFAPPPPAPPPPLPVEEYLRYRPQSSSRRVPIHDADSLRMLLPQAHRHLLPNPAATTSTTATATTSPLTHTCQSMSNLQLRSNPDGEKQKWSPAGVVREAWPSVEIATTPEVVVRLRRPSRRSSSENRTEQRNLNALNNNDEDEELEDFAAKRRSYHPQDYLSKLLTRSSHSGRKSDFPKVIFLIILHAKLLSHFWFTKEVPILVG